MARVSAAIALSLALSIICSTCVQAALVPKQLAGPPEEFASHALPSTFSGAITSSTALLPVIFAEDGNGNAVWQHTMHFDTRREVDLEIYSPVSEHLEATLTNSRGKKVNMKKREAKATMLDYDADEFVGVGYDFQRARPGLYTLTITAPGMSIEKIEAAFPQRPEERGGRHGFVLFATDSNKQIYSHLNTYHLVEGESIGLGSLMYDEAATPFRRLGGMPPVDLNSTVTDAQMEVQFPDGHVEVFPMKDDGLSGADGAADDGEYGATFTASQPGQYILEAKLAGDNGDGGFERSTEHIVNVLPRLVTTSGTAFGSMDKTTNRLKLNLRVSAASQNATKFRVYAQVWGVKDGVPEAACWVSTLATVTQVNGEKVLAMELDLKWLQRASVEPPLVLKDVQVQDVDYFVPLDTYASMPVNLTESVLREMRGVVLSLGASGYGGEITQEMRQGVRPARNVTAETSGGLVLIHGYCAKQNPWELSSDIFTNAIYFKKLNSGLTHDQFASLVDEFAIQNGYQSYAALGASQGGMISTHLLNFYFSGLDHATSGRLVQSVGSPYLGNTASGVIADIGKLLGIGCGSNSDMTVDGAARWYATLSVDTLEHVYYYTTQYKTGLFRVGWCDFWNNLLIRKPNDGVAEYDYSLLPGAHHVSHTKGECHIEGMKWPAGFLNRDRNAEMNAAAARGHN